MNFMSSSDEDSYHHLPQKRSECTIFANLSLFEIVLAISFSMYYQCCSELSRIVTPVLYYNFFCWRIGKTVKQYI